MVFYGKDRNTREPLGYKVNQDTIDCFKCTYFYITWDKNHPYGCKAMGFKSKQISGIVVQQSSGKNCMYFKHKQTQTDK